MVRKSPALASRLSRTSVGFRGRHGGFTGLGLTDPNTGQTVTPPAPGDCSGANGVPAQYNCSLYNQLTGTQFKYANVGTASAPILVPQYGSPSAPSSSAASLSFSTSRGGNTVQPGDTWQIRITGAAPNSAVSVLGVHPDGGSATASEGTTDGSGNFSLSGSFDSSMIGTWKETWSVGGQSVGSFSFTVQAPPSSAGGGGGTAAPPPAGGSGAPSPPAGGGGGASVSGSSFWTDSAFLGVPNWVLVGGVGLGGLLLFSRGGGRR